MIKITAGIELVHRERFEAHRIRMPMRSNYYVSREAADNGIYE